MQFNFKRDSKRPAAAAALALAVGFLATACAIQTPPTQYFILESPDLPKAETPLDLLVGIESLEPSRIYGQERIAYRASDYEIAFYPYQRWAVAPDLMVAEEIRTLLAESGRFNRVDLSPCSPSIDISVSGQLQEIYQDERDPDDWRAVLKISWQIRDGQTDKVLSRLVTSRSIAPTEHTADAVVAAISRATTAAAAELSDAIAAAKP